MQRTCPRHAAFLTSGKIVLHESGETEKLSVAPGSETSGNLVSGEIEEENTDDVTELNLAGGGRGRKGRKCGFTEVDATFQETRDD